MSTIALIDCNNFFVSCERLFRPDLAHTPVIVLSSNDGCVISRSAEAKALGLKMGEPYFKIRALCEKNSITVFSSNFDLYRDLSRRVMETLRRFSDEVEVYSVDEAFLTRTFNKAPSASLLSSCEPSSYTAYDSSSHSSAPRIRSLLERSVDGCAAHDSWITSRSRPGSVGQASQAPHNDDVGMSGLHVETPHSHSHTHSHVSRRNSQVKGDSHTPLHAWGKDIRDTVLREVGIPVSVGIAPTKTLAKVATHFAKNPPSGYGNAYVNGDGHTVTNGHCVSGVCVLLDEHQRAHALDLLPVEEIWGVGFRLAPKLKAYGIDTAAKLVAMDDQWIRKHMSIRGLRTVHELRGTRCFDVGEDSTLRKSLLHSQSFGSAVRDLSDLRAAIAYHARKVAETLRTEGAVARQVFVTIRTSRHGSGTRYAAFDGDILPLHTNDTLELVSQALAILSRLYRRNISYAKAGVMVADIIPETAIHPTTLFGTATRALDPLMQTLDTLRGRFGPDTVRLGVEGKRASWSARHTLLSPRYTTQWSEVPAVHSGIS